MIRYSHNSLYRDRNGVWHFHNYAQELSMQRTPVESTNIDSVGFDPKEKIMEIAFKGGGVYQYTGATVEKHYADLMAAVSKGKHFTKHIRHDPELKVTRIS